MGIEFLPDSLTWKPEMRPEWDLWTDWYEAVASSSGFKAAADSSESPNLSPRLEAIAARARPIHEYLKSLCL